MDLLKVPSDEDFLAEERSSSRPVERMTVFENLFSRGLCMLRFVLLIRTLVLCHERQICSNMINLYELSVLLDISLLNSIIHQVYLACTKDTNHIVVSFCIMVSLALEEFIMELMRRYECVCTTFWQYYLLNWMSVLLLICFELQRIVQLDDSQLEGTGTGEALIE